MYRLREWVLLQYMYRPRESVLLQYMYRLRKWVLLQTVDLLYSMANETNVKVVCSKLIERLDNPAGNSSKSELIDRILTLTEKYPLHCSYNEPSSITVLYQLQPYSICN